VLATIFGAQDVDVLDLHFAGLVVEIEDRRAMRVCEEVDCMGMGGRVLLFVVSE
jgi:hypothetical protein